VDGDTIKLNGTTWRLWGIDARSLVNGAWMDGMPA
jgi:endonuclease YncB( thermonuclease family)